MTVTKMSSAPVSVVALKMRRRELPVVMLLLSSSSGSVDRRSAVSRPHTTAV
jgi:hypothetical protein